MLRRFIPNFRIAFKTNNSVECHLRAKQQYTRNNNKYLACSFDKLTSPFCGKAYVGQNGKGLPRGLKSIFFFAFINVLKYGHSFDR